MSKQQLGAERPALRSRRFETAGDGTFPTHPSKRGIRKRNTKPETRSMRGVCARETEAYNATVDRNGRGGQGQAGTVISLFTGAMGLDLGLEQAGFRVAVAVESDAIAVNTILANRPALPIIDRPIEDVTTEEILERAGLRRGDVTLVAGGPACQTFSTAGRRRSLADPLGKLFYQFVQVIEEAEPEFFVMENVRGLLSAAVRHRPLAQRGPGNVALRPNEELGSAFRKMTRRLKQVGYYVRFDVLNSADYGCAQTRKRLVILGSRDGHSVAMPSPTHAEDEANHLPRWRTLREALTGLERSQHHHTQFVPSRRKYFNHVPAGGNWRDLPKHLRRKALGAAIDSWGGRSGFFRRLCWDKPSPTLNTNPDYKATALCHPSKPRPLSVEEYKRIQGFPDDWVVTGSIREQYRQLGNAVPVVLGAALGQAVRAAHRKRAQQVLKGRVECWNLDVLESLSDRPRTQLNPPRMRTRETQQAKMKWANGRGTTRDDAKPYTPPHLNGAVTARRLAKRVTEKLRVVYESPDLGNYEEPVDELFFIILSQRTTGPSYERVFRRFKDWVGAWDNLPAKRVDSVRRVISSAGLGSQKAEWIVDIARRLRRDFGSVTLTPLAEESDEGVEHYLVRLPGVGIKTAKCVMMFAMGRHVLPVDAHVERVARRTGIVQQATAGTKLHEVIEMVVPPDLRREFHVNAVAHGRKMCRARRPKCVECPIRRLCVTGQRRGSKSMYATTAH